MHRDICRTASRRRLALAAILAACLFDFAATHAPAQTPSPAPLSTPLSAEAIMAQVAAHQDQAEAARRHYVYQQHTRISSRKGHTVMCEEITETRITPSATGSTSTLLSLQGRLLRNHQYVTYSSLAHSDHDHPPQSEDTGIDRDLVEDLRSDLLGHSDPSPVQAAENTTDPAGQRENKAAKQDAASSANEPAGKPDSTRDGIDTRLFPLTSGNQSGYRFQLLGREQMNGHAVFHIAFRPRPQAASNNGDDDSPEWKGDAYIDTTAFEPVLVRTTMAHNIPFAVRTLLGTSLPGLGFAVTYAPQPDTAQPGSAPAIWFPATFGTEFRIHVLFLFSREIILSAENHDFEQTHVSSTIVGDPKSVGDANARSPQSP